MLKDLFGDVCDVDISEIINTRYQHYRATMNMKGDWALSPAYDITYVYDPTNYWLSKHQMSINGKVENITKQDLLDCGKRMNISKMRSTKIIEDVGEKIEKWLSYAEQAKVKEQTAEMIQKNLK